MIDNKYEFSRPLLKGDLALKTNYVPTETHRLGSPKIPEFPLKILVLDRVGEPRIFFIV